MYTAFSTPLFGLKEPAPPLQIPPVATVTAPARVTVGLFAQLVRSAPAFAVGEGVNETVTWSVTALHRPLPVVVNVSVTKPAATSAGVGVYVAFIVTLFGE